jgi:hypothetical protein
MSNEPLTVTINGQPVTASMDEWDRVTKEIAARRYADRKAWEDEQRRAGKVWTALYWMHHSEYADEFFSLEDARSFLVGGEDYGNLSAVGVRHPDGTIEPFTWDWESAGVLKTPNVSTALIDLRC